MENQFSTLELTEFTKLVGANFEYLAGPTLGADLVSDLIILCTTTGNIAIQGDICELDFEGFTETYSKLIVNPKSEKYLGEAKNNGNLFFFKAGEKISSVMILRNFVTCFENHKLSWEYVSDAGLILKMESGYLAITKLGQHDELLAVTYLDELDMSQLPNLTSAFQDSLETQIENNRKILTLDEALRESLN